MVIIGNVKKKYPFVDAKQLKRLFFYHFLLSFAYFAYVLFNPSDSRAYYEKVARNWRGENWLDFYGTSTTFIEFLGYPFIKYLGFSYEAMMVLFSFSGFIGFLYFYIFFKEHIRYKHKIFGMDFFTLIFFLPNLHFWSSSFGKGSVIFCGLGLFFFGLGKLDKRIIYVLVGGALIYHVRPHVMLILLVCSALGFVFSTKGISLGWRLFFLAGCAVAFSFIYQDVLSLVGIDEEEFITQGLDLTHRAKELSNTSSGVDLTNYSLPMQVFTFLYRPLFVDAPGALGIIVSFENIFYLFVTLKLLFNSRSYRFLITSSFLVKSSITSFLIVSTALAQVSANLGLAMRQKSQIMILLMFVVLSFLDDQKKKAAAQAQRARMARLHNEQQLEAIRSASGK